MLEISNLRVKIDNKEIIKNLSLNVREGEVHAIMGPNGSGKSTLAKTIAGFPDYEIAAGRIEYRQNNLLELDIVQRALGGIFLGLQYPVEIPGVNNETFLRIMFNAHQRAKKLDELDTFDFREFVLSKMKRLEIKTESLERGLNEGFSGGEKKKNEILQLELISPHLAILDETDSGLDIDALQIVASGINNFRNSKRAIILITHYNRLLDYVRPDFIHVLTNGQIVETGDYQLAKKLEEVGYGLHH